jgi:hypothetical protein
VELVLEFMIDAELAEPLLLPNGPYGTRVVVPAVGGTVRGERISGSLVGAGGDWVLIGHDGWGRIDVRSQVRTEDGALLYLTYTGLLEMNDKVMAAILTDGEETGFADQYFRTTPRLETGDERYTWANQTVFVGRGRVTRNGVGYEVFRVT